jgi:hypothetical protein
MINKAQIRYHNGQLWYHNGQLHRVGGPAIVRADGSEEYWEHGRRIIKNDHAGPSARR